MRYNKEQKVNWLDRQHETHMGLVNDAYESPTTGDIVYEIRELSYDKRVISYPFVREDELQDCEGPQE